MHNAHCLVSIILSGVILIIILNYFSMEVEERKTGVTNLWEIFSSICCIFSFRNYGKVIMDVLSHIEYKKTVNMLNSLGWECALLSKLI